MVEHAGCLFVMKSSLRDIAAVPYGTNTDGIMSEMLTFKGRQIMNISRY